MSSSSFFSSGERATAVDEPRGSLDSPKPVRRPGIANSPYTVVGVDAEGCAPHGCLAANSKICFFWSVVPRLGVVSHVVTEMGVAMKSSISWRVEVASTVIRV